VPLRTRTAAAQRHAGTESREDIAGALEPFVLMRGTRSDAAWAGAGCMVLSSVWRARAPNPSKILSSWDSAPRDPIGGTRPRFVTCAGSEPDVACRRLDDERAMLYFDLIGISLGDARAPLSRISWPSASTNSRATSSRSGSMRTALRARPTGQRPQCSLSSTLAASPFLASRRHASSVAPTSCCSTAGSVGRSRSPRPTSSCRLTIADPATYRLDHG
jgi:hypothetical protein